LNPCLDGADGSTGTRGPAGYYDTPRDQRINPNLIPQELRDRRQWVVWRLKKRDGKSTKVPFRARNTKREASSTDPKSWGGFDEALAAFLRDKTLDGIGFVFCPDGPYAGIDFDNCLGPDGSIAEWALEKLKRFPGGWAAISPSGNGIKIVVHGDLGGKKGTNRKGFGPDGKAGIECYDRGRFFTITSEVLDADQVAIKGDHTAELRALHAELARKAVKAKDRTAPPQTEVLGVDDGALLDRIRRSKQGAKFAALYDHGDTSAHHGDDSGADFALCCILAFWTNKDTARIERLFSGSRLARREKWGRADYRARTIAAACEATTETYRPPAAKKKREDRSDAETQVPRDRPPIQRAEIEINTRWHEAQEQTLAILRHDPDLYRRGDVLVTVAVESEDEIPLTACTVLKGMAGTPRVIVLSPSNLGCRLTRIAEFFQWTKDKAGESIAVQVRPPQWLIEAVATHCHYPGVRRVLAVVECPYPRLDGSIVDTPGYDPATGTIYWPSMKFRAVPAYPSREQAREAAGRLLAVFRQFPFASDEDRAVCLAGILTVIARPIIDGPVPGIAVIGNKAGVGKGLLIDGIGIIGTGRSVPTSTYPEEKDEAAKVKVSIALAGPPVVHFDNLDEGSFYGNGAFDSTITSITVNERILGASRNTGEVPLRTSWFLSGNNLSPGKDAYRRWLPCNLVSDLERPEEREDIAIPDLRKHIMQRRAELVRDALTILSAHALDGYSDAPKAPLGSFEQWDRIVRGAVLYAYGIDPCHTRRAAADEAPARLTRLALLEGWKELPGGLLSGVTAAKAVKFVEENKDLYDTLRNALLQHGRDGKLAQSRSLGHIIKGMKGNTIEGMKFVEAGKEHGTVLWKVEVLDEASACGGNGWNGGVTNPQTRAETTDHHDVMMYEKTRNGSPMGEENAPRSTHSPLWADDPEALAEREAIQAAG
jgi:primase-polymerase (primpol)-like protein